MPPSINCRVLQLKDAMRFDSDTNRNETNRIFIAFISESIEKFTALEILSGTLQFTCRLPARRGDACAQTRTQTQAATGSRQRVELKRGELPPLETANNSSCCQRISHATFSLYFPWEIFGMQRKVALYEIRSIASWLQLVFSPHFTSNCHFPSLHSVDCPPVPIPLLLLLSILLLFTLHWPLCCICFQFQLLRTVSPSDSASSLPFSCALPCSTIATWRIRNQPIPDLQLQFHFNTLGQINAMVNARYARIQEAKLMFIKDINPVKGSIVLFS